MFHNHEFEPFTDSAVNNECLQPTPLQYIGVVCSVAENETHTCQLSGISSSHIDIMQLLAPLR